jgi:hypothetical protein
VIGFKNRYQILIQVLFRRRPNYVPLTQPLEKLSSGLQDSLLACIFLRFAKSLLFGVKFIPAPLGNSIRIRIALGFFLGAVSGMGAQSHQKDANRCQENP